MHLYKVRGAPSLSLAIIALCGVISESLKHGDVDEVIRELDDQEGQQDIVDSVLDGVRTDASTSNTSTPLPHELPESHPHYRPLSVPDTERPPAESVEDIDPDELDNSQPPA